MISIRRKLMAQRAPIPTEYVTDGLVLWLDGINKGNTANAWTDLVAGHVFSGGSTTVYGTDYVEFDRTINSRLTNSTFDTPATNSGTIEIVYDTSVALSNAEMVMYTPKAVSQLSFGIYWNAIVYDKQFRGSTAPYVTYNAYSTGNFSVSALGAYHDGIAETPRTNKDFWGDSDEPYNVVGGILNNANRCFLGKIYCIRIYNRQLTQAEARANYAVDQSRFSLFN